MNSIMSSVLTFCFLVTGEPNYVLMNEINLIVSIFPVARSHCNQAHYDAFNQLYKTTCTGSSTVSCRIEGSVVTDTNCDTSNFNYATVIRSNITGSRLSSKQGERCHVSDCEMKNGVPTSSCKITGCDYGFVRGPETKNGDSCNKTRTQVTNSRCSGSVLTDCDLNESDMMSTKCTNSNLNGVRIDSSTITATLLRNKENQLCVVSSCTISDGRHPAPPCKITGCDT